jgi:hypothetical protein
MRCDSNSKVVWQKLKVLGWLSRLSVFWWILESSLGSMWVLKWHLLTLQSYRLPRQARGSVWWPTLIFQPILWEDPSHSWADLFCLQAQLCSSLPEMFVWMAGRPALGHPTQIQLILRGWNQEQLFPGPLSCCIHCSFQNYAWWLASGMSRFRVVQRDLNLSVSRLSGNICGLLTIARSSRVLAAYPSSVLQYFYLS